MNGKILKAELALSGKRAYEIAAAAHVAPRTLSDIYAGRVEPTPEVVERLRNAMWGDNPPKIIIENIS